MVSVIGLLFLVLLLSLDRDYDRDGAILVAFMLLQFFWHLVPWHSLSDKVVAVTSAQMSVQVPTRALSGTDRPKVKTEEGCHNLQIDACKILKPHN